MSDFSPSELPTSSQLDAARKLSVLDEQGQEVPFAALVDGHKAIVIFIRHFFCGLVRLELCFECLGGIRAGLGRESGVCDDSSRRAARELTSLLLLRAHPVPRLPLLPLDAPPTLPPLDPLDQARRHRLRLALAHRAVPRPARVPL